MGCLGMFSLLAGSQEEMERPAPLHSQADLMAVSVAASELSPHALSHREPTSPPPRNLATQTAAWATTPAPYHERHRRHAARHIDAIDP
jgi:hypothetical protein